MKKLLKPYVLIPFFLILAVSSIFWIWWILPVKNLDVVVLNKNVPASQIDKNNNITGDYRKHSGLFWILKNQRYQNPETGKFYNYKKDYYGPILDIQSNIIGENKLQKLDRVPDLIYLADAYGDSGNDSIEKGITESDMGVISTAFTQGSRIVGEFNISSDPTSKEVKAELRDLFGVSCTGWIGRFIYDLADLTDVPPWALTLYETQYGKVWDLDGSGLLIVSQDGELIILRQGSDYTGNTLSVKICPEYQKEYGALSVNYYNWFELNTANYGTDTIAEYSLSLTASGTGKFSKIADSFVFPAVTVKKAGKSCAWYFSGDFNDYVSSPRMSEYLIAEKFNQAFSYEKKGDITNFFWKFYTPLMRCILKDAYKNKPAAISKPASQAAFRISGGNFEIKKGDLWEPFSIRGFNINGIMPGSSEKEYTRDISIYREFINSIKEIGGNTVRVQDLMPPEFYRAIYEYNTSHPDAPVYFIQSILPSGNIAEGESLSDAAVEENRKNIEYTVNAVHGNAVVPKIGRREGGNYINDVSPWICAYIIENKIGMEAVKALETKYPGYTFNGTWFESGSSAAEACVASLCDTLFNFETKTYQCMTPVGALGNVALLENSPWKSDAGGTVFDLQRITAKGDAASRFFLAYDAQPADKVFLDRQTLYQSYKDDSGSFPYGGYLTDIRKYGSKYPVLIDRFGLSTNVNAFEKETLINGLSEAEQGAGIVRMMKAIAKESFLGGLVSDWNDNWESISDEYKEYVIPEKNRVLWQNALDPAQNAGIMAVEPASPDTDEMILQDNGRMSQMICSANENYLYLTILFSQEIDYEKESLMIGLDTYQRNSGEYLYHPNYFATSLSGLEYLIRFESNRSGGIYVIPSYNRNKGKYSSKTGNTGLYDFICPLKYGTFETSNSNFYFTGTNLHIRIPWSVLNFTDPSRKMVLEDPRTPQEILADPFRIRTQTTDGILFSVVISDIKTYDTLYQFPKSKESTGYKTFKWENWSTVKYKLRLKESGSVIERYYNTLDMN